MTARARERLAIPFLDPAEAAWVELAGGEPVAVGLLSTRRAAAKGNFQSVAKRHGAALVIPSPHTAARVDEAIFSELVLGRVTPRSTRVLRDATTEVVPAGADAVVLGNTDMSLAIQVLREATSVRLVDAARAPARAAARTAFRASANADPGGGAAGRDP